MLLTATGARNAEGLPDGQPFFRASRKRVQTVMNGTVWVL